LENGSRLEKDPRLEKDARLEEDLAKGDREKARVEPKLGAADRCATPAVFCRVWAQPLSSEQLALRLLLR
jgi:hypothetical protein